MIDLHTHILPGVDDGAKDMEQALDMARQAAAHGVKTVAATPHFLNVTWSEIKEKTAYFQQVVRENGIALDVVVGAEIYVDPELIDLPADEIPTYNDAGRYCLIEFPMLELPPYIDQVLFSLQVKGITPIIAHPERYQAVIRNPNLAAGWIEAGCLIQMNANSILGLFGEKVKQTSKIMLQHNMVHVLASDAHSTGRRGFYLDRCVEAAQRLVAPADIEKLVSTNPALVIAGEPVEIPEVRIYRPRKRLWFFRK